MPNNALVVVDMSANIAEDKVEHPSNVYGDTYCNVYGRTMLVNLVLVKAESPK
jgi:hypothetical protein